MVSFYSAVLRLRGHGVTAAALEGTGVYWQAPFEALEDAGIYADLLHAQHVKPTNDHSDDAAKLFARTPASEQLQAFATAKRLFTATTKTAPPRKSTRFAMIRVATSPM